MIPGDIRDRLEKVLSGSDLRTMVLGLATVVGDLVEDLELRTEALEEDLPGPELTTADGMTVLRTRHPDSWRITDIRSGTTWKIQGSQLVRIEHPRTAPAASWPLGQRPAQELAELAAQATTPAAVLRLAGDQLRRLAEEGSEMNLRGAAILLQAAAGILDD